MSEELLRRLRLLEEEYPGQPPVARRADLRAINQLRAQLGMPPVDERLNESRGAADEEAEEAAEPEPDAVEDHAEARAVYQAYLKKVEELEVHRAYAEEVADATAGRGQTPVRPLATMGPGGGPLLCDHCGKPIVLEGGRYNGVTADVAWRQNPREGWTSWILGGMVVELQTNGTLRIYHGYPGRGERHCCNIASRQDKEARAAFDSSKRPEMMSKVVAFLRHEFPEQTREEHEELLKDILDTMCSYDPGIGVNRPGEGS